MSNFVLAPTLLLFVLISLLPSTVCWTYEEEFNFRNIALQNYNKYIRPLNDLSETILVDLSISISKISDFDIVKGELKVEMWLLLSWTDERICWNETVHKVTEVSLSNNKLWSPTISLHHTENTIDFSEDTHLYLFSNGSVTQWRRRYFNIFCDVDVYAFPFDKHNCETILYFSHYNIRRARFTSLFCQDITNFTNTNWVIRVSCEIKDMHNFSQAFLTLKLERKFQLQCLSTLLPLFIFLILNIMVGHLPIESGEKVTFATTVFLSNIVYFEDVSKQLPREPSRVPLIFLCHLIMTFLTGLAVVGAIVTSKIFRKTKSSQMVETSKTDAKNYQVQFISNEGGDNNDPDFMKDNDAKIMDGRRRNCEDYSKIESMMLYIMTFISVLFAFVFAGLFSESIFQ